MAMATRFTIMRDYDGWVADYSPTYYKTFDKAIKVLNKTIQRIVRETLKQGYDIAITHECTDNYDDKSGYGYDAIKIVSNGTNVIYFISTFKTN